MKIRFVTLIALLLSLMLPVGAQPPCGDALPPRLLSGSDAEVLFTDGSPLNVRAEASRTAEIVERLPEGSRFPVRDIGTCNVDDGIIWYPVYAGDVAGWVAESVGGEYLVAPYNAVSLSDVLPEDAVIAAYSNREFVLLNRKLAPLKTFEGAFFSGIVRNNALYLHYASLPDREGTGIIAYHADGETHIYTTPSTQRAEAVTMVNFMPSPDGAQMAWLFDVTTVRPTFDGCEESDGCLGRLFEVIITEADGGEIARHALTFDDPYPYVVIQSWVGSEIMLERHMWGLASCCFPIEGGGIMGLNAETGELTEYTPLTDTDELLSPEGTRLATSIFRTNVASVLDFATGEVLWSEENEEDISGALSFSPDGRYLVYGVQVWDTQTVDMRAANLDTGEIRPLITFDSLAEAYPENYPLVSAWLSDTVAVISQAGTLHLFDVSTGKAVYFGRVTDAPGDEGREIGFFIGGYR